MKSFFLLLLLTVLVRSVKIVMETGCDINVDIFDFDHEDGEPYFKATCDVDKEATFNWTKPEGEVEISIRNTGKCDAPCDQTIDPFCCDTDSDTNCAAFYFSGHPGDNVQFFDTDGVLLGPDSDGVLNVSPIGTVGKDMMANVRIRPLKEDEPINFKFLLNSHICPRSADVIMRVVFKNQE
eukprot:UN28813